MQALIAVIVAFIVTAAVLWFFFAPRKAFRARVDNGVQEAVVEVKGGYSPAIIEAEAGLPLRLIFDRKEDGECSSHVVFSDFGVDLALPAFRTTTLTLHPNEPGEYGFACGMNMLHGTLRVVPGKHHAAMPKEHSESEESTNTAESHVHMQSQQTVVDEKSYESAESSNISSDSSDSSNDSSESREMRTLIARLIVSAVVTIPVFGSTMLMLYPMPNWVQFVLMLPVMCYAALPFFRSGFAAIIHRSPEMNALVSLGTVCAFAYSCVVTFIPQILPENAREPYFEAVGVVITLMLVGQLLEARARVGTGEAMRALAGLQPKNARVVRGEIEEEIPVEQVAVGDIIAIRPGEQLPVDGVVIAGSSAVDESMITGESMPVVKQAGSSVTGATINGTGSLRYRATKVGKDTVLAQIIGLVQSAQSSKAPVQRMADKISGIFVPIVVLIAVWSCALWFAFGPEPRVVHALVAAVSVLLIACPCALGLATPLSVTVSTGRAAQMGVLIRSAEALETCGKINAVVLDKTGTITAGTPSLTDVFLLGKWRKMPDDLLAITASAERDSEHPLAAAIVAGAQEKHLTLGETTQFRAISGRGVTAHVALPLISANNPTVAADESSASSVTFESSISSPETAMYNVAVGNTDLIDDLDVGMPSVGDEDLDDIIATMERLSAEGKTPMLAAIDGELAGIVAVADTVKASTFWKIHFLRNKKMNSLSLFYILTKCIIIFSSCNFQNILCMELSHGNTGDFPSALSCYSDSSNTGMVGTIQCKHIPSVLTEIVAGMGISAVVQIHQHFPVLVAYRKMVSSISEIKVNIFPVHGSHTGYIFRLFHSSFDFKRINSCFNQIRNQLKGTDVFQTQIVFLLSICCIRKSARLGTLPSVATPSTNHAAEKALA